MITNAFVEKIALFYHLALLDEARAQNTTDKTLKKIREQQIAAKMIGRQVSNVDFIRLTSSHLDKSKKQIRPTHLAFSSGELILPEKSNFGPWFEFRKVADESEFNAVLYSKIMKFTDDEISSGLNVPIGTVRYRVARGLRTLGRICMLGSHHRES